MTLEEVKKMHEEWEKSGITQQDYCERLGVKLKTFKNRLRYAREKGIVKAKYKRKKQSLCGKFKSIQIVEEPREEPKRAMEAYCRIQFNNEHWIEISSQESLKQLKEMLR